MWGLSYWVFPVISAIVWLTMLISMITYWAATGKPFYASEVPGQYIPYISDIGAETLKPWFIAGSCLTTIFLDMAFISERWLREKGLLVQNITKTEKVLSGLSILFALVGTAGLILLSIFDTLRHPRLHDIFLLLFLGGYIISAIFTCWEYQRLGIFFREHRILRISFWIKLFFIIIEVALAIAFAVCISKTVSNAGAIIEWVIAFIFTFYVGSYYFDLRPAIRTSRGKSLEGQTEMQAESNDLHSAQHQRSSRRHH